MISPDWYPTDKQLRQFAIACLLGSALVGYSLYRWSHDPTASYVLVGIGAICCGVGLLRPGALRPVYYLVMAVATPVGWVLSNLLLRIFYYGVLTPLGLVFRLIGRDALWLKKPPMSSYWQVHVQETDPRTYYRQA